ncbi:hypothetical protein TYRP_017492 [Tyrophagus putrescentiae]|nr:hypothetical protein TYRP_017492 [Tyrophagus putrescentiae]
MSDRPSLACISSVNRSASTPSRSSIGTRDRKMALARRQSFFPWAIVDGSGAQRPSTSTSRWAQALRPPNEQTNHQIGILLHRLAVDPDAEAEKVQVALALHRVPANVGVALVN